MVLEYHDRINERLSVPGHVIPTLLRLGLVKVRRGGFDGQHVYSPLRILCNRCIDVIDFIMCERRRGLGLTRDVKCSPLLDSIAKDPRGLRFFHPLVVSLEE